MDRLLCDCVIALAVLLCVATQVRPAYLTVVCSELDDIMVSVCVTERRQRRSNSEADFL